MQQFNEKEKATHIKTYKDPFTTTFNGFLLARELLERKKGSILVTTEKVKPSRKNTNVKR